ncbi:unnamed protein product [Parascedosporium putredinis]|uniref:Anaphase-promoting complex subunit CDC26 n=1 Tax=Parascedosporium putredinis TaxID=1442378 RepID=A0A9P1HBT3_9PEZI|nr:unnamed protein product [Parascedosporium putredinis]CAI8002366.1 unnamed protein product [Parascedosporium putredinis]
MLRRPATTLSITAEDVAAYEDRRAREAAAVLETVSNVTSGDMAEDDWSGAASGGPDKGVMSTAWKEGT